MRRLAHGVGAVDMFLVQALRRAQKQVAHLPIDQLEPWLDARLTEDERTSIAELFRRRIESRKPASYLVNAAFIQGRIVAGADAVA